MIVFKTFIKIIKKYKGTIILYTTMLLIFGTINMSSNSINTTFTSTKPDIAIVNNDENIGLTKNLIDYLSVNTNVKNIDKENIDDALFYRDINYIIYIPKDYRKDILAGKKVNIDIKTTKDYNSYIADILIKKYIKIQDMYINGTNNEKELINLINRALESNINVEVKSNNNTNELNNLTKYFNFASYSIMAVIIYIICLVMTSFREENINKKIIVSSMNYKKHNLYIFLSSILYSLIVWIIYILLGIFAVKTNIFNLYGAIYTINLLIFTIVSLSLALLISNLIKNKSAVNGIVNVVALGSAFLCGAFVPMEYLPNTVLKISHVLPSYWYVKTNNLLTDVDVLNINTLKPIFINMLVMIAFILIFILLNNIVSKRKMSK